MKNFRDCMKDNENARSGNYRDSGRIQDIWVLEGKDSVIRDLGEIISKKNWERYRRKSQLISASIISN